MKKPRTRTLAVISVLVGAAYAFPVLAAPGKCELTIERTACPGYAERAFRPYGGKAASKEVHRVQTATECARIAEAASKVVRVGTIRSKRVTAKFESVPVENGRVWADSTPCR